MIYFVQGERSQRIKIGHTDNLDARLRTLQTSSSEYLALLLAIPGGKEEESYLHQRFDYAREQGEWFRPVPKLLDFIMKARSRRTLAIDLTAKAARPREPELMRDLASALTAALDGGAARERTEDEWEHLRRVTINLRRAMGGAGELDFRERLARQSLGDVAKQIPHAEYRALALQNLGAALSLLAQAEALRNQARRTQ